MSRCLLIAAGPMQDIPALRRLVRPDDYILCADGGADNARRLGVRPQRVLGDLDSVERLPEGVPAERFPPEKDDTDTMLAVKRALVMGYRSFLLLGAWGGRPDHAYANLCALLYLAEHGASGTIADGGVEIHVVKNGSLRLKKREDYYVSVFPFDGPADGVNETGMKYGLTDACLRTADPLGVSNEFRDEQAVISVKRGALLIMLCPKSCGLPLNSRHLG
ncbi:thiamine diphosphokinase [Ethanoligenens harbinense]|uniref:Thiamine diphosphokinase n=1 Tax=Ethanoligenens harbinense (strain DSM 18485 / JCM 12961 / CGMCC 1.5033 / YUAN-3) TaxID=663278 RepID=E6U3M5_ETHHY|nr:thiamine diphosphokinase [Ethanoligenens harbinense]ADU27625.1 thiamine pyrophosphokinase [Ethanoligenens harbinense YUAN-3]AVQ96663.1 thiamine diphosphokinase [Ethanoligenens harbinense YUAN-3]AYF39323.1 thiamine diphosphokinase [Ethanoligenens harbinense]AYF42148.1 thiamine diphosphokinase [Ethanoligenens harbinense]QCN92903.1 thiamine diphosphokinase [Ethanoligenens harbinense]